jgi:hypothetical protein
MLVYDIRMIRRLENLNLGKVCFDKTGLHIEECRCLLGPVICTYLPMIHAGAKDGRKMTKLAYYSICIFLGGGGGDNGSICIMDLY